MMIRLDNISESQFGKIIDSIEENSRLSSEAFEKLLVALTGTFRLLDGKQSVLTSLQGNPAEVQAYILNLLNQVKSMVADGYNSLKEDIQDLAQKLESS
jgi:hypothetical protein